MEIVKINKTGLFYKVKLDNNEVYKFHESVIISYGLIRKNIEVNNQTLEKALKDNEYYIALDKGIAYLSVLRSEYDVLQYLKTKYEIEIVNKVISQLKKMKLINDLEYSRFFVSLMQKKCYGKNKILNELKNKNISSEITDIVMEEIDYSLEEENCLKCFSKYLVALKNDSRMSSRRKMIEYLKNHGFSNEIITIVLEKNVEKLDNIVDEDKSLVIAYKKILKSKKANTDEKKFKNKIIRSLTGKGFPLSKVLRILKGGVKYD